MTKHIRLLDCTLRDGGHIVEGNFGEKVINSIIGSLVSSGVDIIEVGFLWNKRCSVDMARYYTISDLKRILPETGESRIALMADYIDLEHLEPSDGTVEYIRLSFKRWRLEWALKTTKVLQDKGYKVIINPVNNNVYSDKQYIELLEEVNRVKPYGFSIVDTFGVMRLRDLSHRYYLVENNLSPDISLGVHLHENLGMAFSLAQKLIEIASPKRNIIIDGSLLGMGREPGNLCIEQMMDFMNDQYDTDYKIEPVYDAIDDYVAPIKIERPWGYALPYALSGKYYLHRSYAEYLMKKWKLRTSDIERILSSVSREEAEIFNEEYIESLYRDYVSVKTNDESDMMELKNEIINREILLIAPGSNILKEKEKILEYMEINNPIVIGIHCVPDFVELEYEFYTNIKRLDVLFKGNTRLIVSSNLKKYMSGEKCFILNYDTMAYHENEFCDDSVMMMLNLLKKMGKRDVSIAGFDGIKNGRGSFYIDSLSRNDRPQYYSDSIKQLLNKYYRDMNINFVTSSYYNDYDRIGDN